ncbi:uncharacterized protein [Leptinotarsa decemlineata]|uniref:uncharacterized protein n=1 Tax=Leptinotarsa decemlineata TaxID=7539 RepID=UPI003D30BA3B
MDKIKTIACVDTSTSTRGDVKYYSKVNSLIRDAFKIITWNSRAEEVNNNVLDEYQACGYTLPQAFLEILKTYDFKYQLLVTTDGQVCDHDIGICESILQSSNILDNIEHFKIYYIGEEVQMNMKLDNLFTSPKFNKEIFINEKVSCTVDINIDFDNVCVEDIIEKNDFKASIISRLSRFPEKRLELRSEVCKLAKRLLNQLVDKNVSIKEFFDNKDVDGCITFIKNSSPSDKKVLQQKISDILNLFKNNTDIYTLSHLSNTRTLHKVDVSVPLEGEDFENDEDIEEGDNAMFCDIMFTKCTHLCLLIRNPKENIIPDLISKQISIHPFLTLSHEDIIKKIVDLVEYQQIDLSSYSQLENKFISPFTRHPLKGVYIFNSGTTDDLNFELIKKNNNRAISVIFGSGNKLPGNKDIWNVLFLYILMKHHPKWKNESEIFKREIRYISEKTKSFLSLSPLLDPNIIDQLNVCLWYVVNVSHKIFPNSSKNILREMGASSQSFLDFYSEVFDTVNEEIYTANKSWLVWNYMVQQKSDRKKLKGEVLAQYQNHKEINGSLVFFSGPCEKRYESFLNTLPVEKVLGLYSILSVRSGKFDEVYVPDTPPNVTIVNILDTLENFETSQHVVICLNTCQLTIICPVTGKYWKECAGNYNVKNASYFRTFRDYSIKKKKYPRDEYDLITYHSDKHYNRCSEFLIYPSYILEEFGLVMRKFENVMKMYPVEEYLKISNANNSEVDRLVTENLCDFESCNHLRNVPCNIPLGHGRNKDSFSK